MNDEERVKRIKDIAAQKAFEAYGRTVAEMLDEEGLSFIEALHGTTHIHSAILFGSKQEAVAIRCQWDFSANPMVVAAGIEMAKKEGQT